MQQRLPVCSIQRLWFPLHVDYDLLSHLGLDKKADILQTKKNYIQFLRWKFLHFVHIFSGICSQGHKPALVLMMAGDKPLFEPMKPSLLMHICVTRRSKLQCYGRSRLRLRSDMVASQVQSVFDFVNDIFISNHCCKQIVYSSLFASGCFSAVTMLIAKCVHSSQF